MNPNTKSPQAAPFFPFPPSPPTAQSDRDGALGSSAHVGPAVHRILEFQVVSWWSQFSDWSNELVSIRDRCFDSNLADWQIRKIGRLADQRQAELVKDLLNSAVLAH